MQFRSLNATFGKLERRALHFAEGLNIIEAPNEAGKSTLTTFLRVMLYGLPTRERGAAADKNLYAPWSGSAMQGRLDLVLDDGAAVTLARDTARANAPMGRFSAVYTGTGEAVPELTAADCGERLTGVPREVYERSAFIRQSGIAVDSDAELERRIAALITTGEEGVSYTEAEAALRRQLNARRHNKTGRIPALDAEIAALEDTAAELRQLSAERRAAENELSDRTEQAEALRAALTRHDLADAQDRLRAVADAGESWQRADAEVEQFYRLLRESGTPARDALEESRARLTALEPLQAAAETAEAQRADAEAALGAFDTAPPARSHSLLPYIIMSAAAFLYFMLVSALPHSISLIGRTASALALFSLLALDGTRSQKARKAHMDERAALERTLQAAQAAAEAQQRLYREAEHDLLAALGVSDSAHAAAYLRENLARWDTFADLTNAERAARVRYETLSGQSNEMQLPAEPVERPAQSREALQAALADCEAAAREAQRRIDYTAGRSRALGELADAESALAEKRAEREVLQGEYDAIALAMDALARANSALQSRFSPALGQRAAELFERMTGGKYHAVLLDRSFRAAAEEIGSPIARDVGSLSQGAADQLYLAVRLAICELVLDTDKSVPLVLDDALVRFDDTRCVQALELLLEESRRRQILLLTCQHREARCLAGREGVHIQTL